jgi:hypothetical protein
VLQPAAGWGVSVERDEFGLAEEDLNLDLGPLGRVL